MGSVHPELPPDDWEAYIRHVTIHLSRYGCGHYSRGRGFSLLFLKVSAIEYVCELAN